MLMKRVGVGALVLLLSACGVRDKDLAAKVDGAGITKKDFEGEAERNLARYKRQGRELPPGVELRIRESVLRRMIDDKIFTLVAKKEKLAVTDEELDKQLEEHKARFRTKEAFEEYLKRSGNTVESIKGDLRRNLIRDRVVEKLAGNVEVTDAEVQKYYDEHASRYVERAQVRAARVLVRLTPSATEAQKKDAQKEAKAILAKLKKPGADFAAIAREASKGPEAANGGELGWLSRGRMGPEIDLLLFGPPPVAPGAPPAAGAPQAEVKLLEAGQLSEVIETKLGYEIIKVLERKPERARPLDEVKESIKSSILSRKRNEARRDVLRKLKADVKIEQLISFEAEQAQKGGSSAPPVAREAAGGLVAPAQEPASSQP